MLLVKRFDRKRGKKYKARRNVKGEESGRRRNGFMEDQQIVVGIVLRQAERKLKAVCLSLDSTRLD